MIQFRLSYAAPHFSNLQHNSLFLIHVNVQCELCAALLPIFFILGSTQEEQLIGMNLHVAGGTKEIIETYDRPKVA